MAGLEAELGRPGVDEGEDSGLRAVGEGALAPHPEHDPAALLHPGEHRRPVIQGDLQLDLLDLQPQALGDRHANLSLVP